MKNKPANQKKEEFRIQLLWKAIIPQMILLVISTVWISFFPKDNISSYLNIKSVFIFYGIGIGVILAFAGYLFYKVSKKITCNGPTSELFEKMLAPTFSSLTVPDIFILSITAGFAEEIFFRGLVLKSFGILIASIAFGLLHLPGKRYWIYALWATLSGALFGYLFLASNSLWLPIIAHSINNIIGMFMLKKVNKSLNQSKSK